MENTENVPLLSPETLKERLADKKLYYVAKKTGLTYPTVKKFADGLGEFCSYQSLRKISAYFTNQESITQVQ